MSIRAMDRSWRMSQNKGAVLLLLLTLSDWADDYDFCYPSLEAMAAKCRQTKRNMLNLVAVLKASGELRTVRHGGGIGMDGTGFTNIYQVTCGLTPEEIENGEEFSPLLRRLGIVLEHPPDVGVEGIRTVANGENPSRGFPPVRYQPADPDQRDRSGAVDESHIGGFVPSDF